jgi:hypothetical protein
MVAGGVDVYREKPVNKTTGVTHRKLVYQYIDCQRPEIFNVFLIRFGPHERHENPNFKDETRQWHCGKDLRIIYEIKFFISQFSFEYVCGFLSFHSDDIKNLRLIHRALLARAQEWEL